MRLLELFSIDGVKGTISTSKYPEWMFNLLGSQCHDAYVFPRILFFDRFHVSHFQCDETFEIDFGYG